MMTGRITGSCQSRPIGVGRELFDPFEGPLDRGPMEQEMLAELGRPDLNAALLTARRDAFLAAALDKLDSWQSATTQPSRYH